MPASGSYYKSSGFFSAIGAVKAALLTIVLSFFLSWLFVWSKSSVSLDWLQLLLLFLFALSLSVLHRAAVRFGKFQNRIADVLWSIVTIACGTYASWIIRLAILHPDHPVRFIPSVIFSGIKEAYSYGVPYYVSFSRILEPGMHIETDPTSTILIEFGVLVAVVVLGAVFLSQEEFFCRECDKFFNVKAESTNLGMPSDWGAVQEKLEDGDSRGLLELKSAPEKRMRLKVAVYRCPMEEHPGIIRITRSTRKKERVGKRDYDADKVIIKGIYMNPAQCNALEDHLKTIKNA